jgi:hypothetical protein
MGDEHGAEAKAASHAAKAGFSYGFVTLFANPPYTVWI